MAALQCDICGGKLTGRPGGVFECSSCGMEYDTAWAKAKMQETSGIVKTGAEEVSAGVVPAQHDKNLEARRQALEVLCETAPKQQMEWQAELQTLSGPFSGARRKKIEARLALLEKELMMWERELAEIDRELAMFD